MTSEYYIEQTGLNPSPCAETSLKLNTTQCTVSSQESKYCSANAVIFFFVVFIKAFVAFIRMWSESKDDKVSHYLSNFKSYMITCIASDISVPRYLHREPERLKTGQPGASFIGSDSKVAAYGGKGRLCGNRFLSMWPCSSKRKRSKVDSACRCEGSHYRRVTAGSRMLHLREVIRKWLHTVALCACVVTGQLRTRPDDKASSEY